MLLVATSPGLASAGAVNLGRNDDPRLVGEDHCLHPVAHPELRQDSAHVGLDRFLAQVQALGKLGALTGLDST
jgi:hypothetical protein